MENRISCSLLYFCTDEFENFPTFSKSIYMSFFCWVACSYIFPLIFSNLLLNATILFLGIRNISSLFYILQTFLPILTGFFIILMFIFTIQIFKKQKKFFMFKLINLFICCLCIWVIVRKPSLSPRFKRISSMFPYKTCIV